MPKLHVPDLARALNDIGKAAKDAATEELRHEANALRDQFVERIRRQDFPSFRRVPLSWQWQSRKAAWNLDPRVMIATGAYTRSIQVFEIPTRSGLQLRIGIHPSVAVRHPLSGRRKRIPMWLLACVHEFGSSAAKVPARPHWHPFFAEAHQVQAPDIARRMVQAVGRKISGRARP